MREVDRAPSRREEGGGCIAEVDEGTHFPWQRKEQDELLAWGALEEFHARWPVFLVRDQVF